MAAIKHALVSAIATDPAATAAGKVTPTNWNADHVITSTAGLALLANLTGAGGAMTEATISQVLDAQDGAAAQGDLLYRNGTVWTALAADTQGKRLVTRGAGANPAWVGSNAVYFPHGNTIGTTSKTGVMCGLADQITPAYTTKFKIIITGICYNVSGVDGVSLGLFWGSGAPPANGAAPTGTQIGFTKTYYPNSVSGSVEIGFTLVGLATGATPTTTYWVDLVQSSINGGLTALASIDVLLEELA